MQRFKELTKRKAEKLGIEIEVENDDSWIFKINNFEVQADLPTIYDEQQKHGDQVIDFMLKYIKESGKE